MYVCVCEEGVLNCVVEGREDYSLNRVVDKQVGVVAVTSDWMEKMSPKTEVGNCVPMVKLR